MTYYGDKPDANGVATMTLPAEHVLWNRIENLIGVTIYNIGNDKQHRIASLTDLKVMFEPGEGISSVSRYEVGVSYQDLNDYGYIRRNGSSGSNVTFKSISLVLIRAAFPDLVGTYPRPRSGIYVVV